MLNSAAGHFCVPNAFRDKVFERRVLFDGSEFEVRNTGEIGNTNIIKPPSKIAGWKVSVRIFCSVIVA